MDWELRRLLEHAGILRRGTPNSMLFEGDDEDPFGGDDEEEDEGGDDAEGDAGPADEKEAPEELEAKDIERFGSPRFLDLQTRVKKMFNDAKTSGAVGAQHREDYPGTAEPIEPEESDEPTPAKDDEVKTEESNESAFLSRRDKRLINEAMRLLNEAETDGVGADIFDMEMFCEEFSNYMESVDFVSDIQKGLYNFARQMMLNNFDKSTEDRFIQVLATKVQSEYDWLPMSRQEEMQIPVAAGAAGDGGAGA
jgi:phage terminase small subunit